MDDVRWLARRVLMPGFAGTTVPGWLRAELAGGLGGVCLFGHNVATIEQVRALTDDVHAYGALVASDEEGGVVSRLGGAYGGSRHVGAAALGMADDLVLTRAVAAANGRDLRAAGIDLDLAPVADVSSNPDNPVIGVRAFGSEPPRVAEHVAAYVTGLHDVGILSCTKHFPGHGDTSVDSHVGLPRIDVDLATLRGRDLVPFAAAVEAGVEAVMTAHIVFGALDERPATTSAAVLRLLRDDLGFDGLIISDAMDMRAMVDSVGLAQGTVRALAAGIDLVAVGDPVLNTGDDERTYRAAYDAVTAAVESGELPGERLEEAARRVDHLAAQADSARHSPTLPAPVGDPDVAAAARALQVTGDVAGRLAGPVTVADVRRHRNIASGRTAGVIAAALLERLPGSRALAVSGQREAAEGRAGGDAVEGRPPDRADVVITGSPWLDERESTALRTLLAADPRTVVVCTGWAPEVDVLAPARHVVRTFGDDLPTAQAVADLLTR